MQCHPPTQSAFLYPWKFITHTQPVLSPPCLSLDALPVLAGLSFLTFDIGRISRIIGRLVK